MSFTQADADRIRAAIAKGVLTVEIAGERVTFDSFDNLRRRLQFIEDGLAGASAKVGIARVGYARTTRGL